MTETTTETQPTPPLPGWLGGLTTEAREAVFTWMRKIGAASAENQRESRWLAGPPNTVPAGAAFFDPFLSAETAEEYLRRLRTGSEPKEALARAKEHARSCVKKHNAQRRRDVHWQRWEGMADTGLDHLHRTLMAELERLDARRYRIWAFEAASLIRHDAIGGAVPLGNAILMMCDPCEGEPQLEELVVGGTTWCRSTLRRVKSVALERAPEKKPHPDLYVVERVQ